MRVLFIGETWITHTVHIKGVDSFEQSGFGCGVGWIKKALESGGHEVTHLPAHQAIDAFPDEQQLTQYDVVICSDVGSNTLVLSTPTMVDSRTRPNALESIRRYVAAGGGFAMIGGYGLCRHAHRTDPAGLAAKDRRPRRAARRECPTGCEGASDCRGDRGCLACGAGL